MSREGLRLVLVDNDRAALDLVLLDLGLEGHNIVATATNGRDALGACEAWAPEVLVVDLRLGPGMDGLDVARQARQRGRRVIIHTNYVTPAIVEAARRVGAVVIEKGSLRALRRAVAGDDAAAP
jgi:CheY-like chemotaxis protein